MPYVLILCFTALTSHPSACMTDNLQIPMKTYEVCVAERKALHIARHPQLVFAVCADNKK